MNPAPAWRGDLLVLPAAWRAVSIAPYSSSVVMPPCRPARVPPPGALIGIGTSLYRAQHAVLGRPASHHRGRGGDHHAVGHLLASSSPLEGTQRCVICALDL